MRYCDECGHRRATHSASDLPDIVRGDIAQVCDDCWGALLERAQVLGEPVR